MQIDRSDKENRIRELNDNFRRNFVGGAVILTQGVASLCEEVRAEILRRVRAFDRFSESNDPYGEHDMGSFKVGNTGFMWKIDYFDRNVEFGSEDPADPTKTTRILTVMLSEEY